MTLTLLFSALSLIIIFYIFRWITKYFELRKILLKIPGPKSYPFIGFEWQIAKIPAEDRLQWVTNEFLKYKKGIVLTWFSTEPFIAIGKPQQIEVILKSNTLISKGNAYYFFRPWLGEGLLTSSGKSWFSHRRLITPAFHFGVLEEYSEVMSEKVQILCEIIESKLHENPKEKINFFQLATNYTLDTICETAMGVDIDTQRNCRNQYVDSLHIISQLISERFISPWNKYDFVYYNTSNGKKFLKHIEDMHDFTRKVVDKKKEERSRITSTNVEDVDEFGRRKRKAFLDLLLDANENHEHPLSLKEILQEVDTFMFAGHDTTSATLSWTLFLLGNNPSVQEKVHEELNQVFSNHDEVATTKQMGQLKYLDRVIKESLRMYPVAGRISRCLDTDVTIDNYFIPKGSNVSIQIYQLHRDPDVWKDPEIFNPDRFLPENSHGRHPYAYIPFSAGPRNCIGQKFALTELKISLTAILRKWRVRSALKPSEIKAKLNIIIRPSNDIIDLYFTPINPTIS